MSIQISPVDPFAGKRHHVIASLVIDDAIRAIEFYKNAFDAQVTHMTNYGGKVAHAEIVIGGTEFMISDEMYGPGVKSAKTIGDTPVTFYAYFKNADEIMDRAVKLGSKIVYPVKDQFYGDRVGEIIDPFGFKWAIATHIKEVPVEAMKQGLEKMMKDVPHNQNQKGGTGTGTSTGNKNYYDKYMKYKTKYLQTTYK
jgi:PhnB protein